MEMCMYIGTYTMCSYFAVSNSCPSTPFGDMTSTSLRESSYIIAIVSIVETIVYARSSGRGMSPFHVGRHVEYTPWYTLR